MRKAMMIAIYILTGLSACIGGDPRDIKETLGLEESTTPTSSTEDTQGSDR